MADILVALAHIFNVLLNLATIVIIASVAISWFNVDPRNRFVSIIHAVSEPMYRPFRILTRRIPGPFDFAPFLALLVIVFLQNRIPYYLMKLAASMN